MRGAVRSGAGRADCGLHVSAVVLGPWIIQTIERCRGNGLAYRCLEISCSASVFERFLEKLRIIESESLGVFQALGRAGTRARRICTVANELGLRAHFL